MSTIAKPYDLVHPECPNFRWYEVWRSSTASRLDICNISTNSRIHSNIQSLVTNILQPLRNELGSIQPSSWYRSEPLEKVLCERSYHNWCKNKGLPITPLSWSSYFQLKSHPQGMAIDIELPQISNDDLYEHIKDNYTFDQLIREFAVEGDPRSGWVHLSWSNNFNRNQAFKYD